MTAAIAAALLQLTPVCNADPGISTQAVSEAISRSAQYLCRQTLTNGMFTYRINTDPAVAVTPKYNMLRHAGTIYAMCMAQKVQPSTALLDRIHLAGAYLRDHAIAPLKNDPKMEAVWSDPDVCGRDGPIVAKLGGAGLGLVALQSIETHTPGFTPRDTLQGLARFILYMQREDGSFHAKYIPTAGGLQSDWISLYYPGEAALGLVMLYERDPNPAWLNGAVNALTHLAHQRHGEETVPADHWALMATERLMAIEEVSDAARNSDLLQQHAHQIVRQILSEQILGGLYPEAEFGFTADGRTTPASTRLEGLFAARQILTDPAMCAEIDTAIIRGMAFLSHAHITEGPYIGGMPRGTVTLRGTDSRTRDANRRKTEIRIDYVQHALSAFIRHLHD